MKTRFQIILLISVSIITQCTTTAVVESPPMKAVIIEPTKKEPDLSEPFKAQLKAMLMGQPNSARYLDTETIGVLDISHIREYANKILELQPLITEKIEATMQHAEKRFSIRLRSGQAGGLTAFTELEIDLNERPKPDVNDLIRDIAFTHGYYVEIRQNDVFPPTFLSKSSFSYEDLQSNRVGIEIGIRSIEKRRPIVDVGLEVLTSLKPKNPLYKKPEIDRRSYSYRPNLKTDAMPELFQYTPPLNITDFRILGIRKLRSNWEWPFTGKPEIE